MTRPDRGRTRCVLVFISLFVPFAYFNHSDGWNQDARFAELHAIVLKRTLAIDDYHEVTEDKALINGHYYSEKAPATVAIALPAFALTVAIERWFGLDPDSPLGWRIAEWTTTAGSVAIVAALGGVAFFVLLQAEIGITMALLSTHALGLGSLTFPYATALFAHSGTIGFLCIALWAALAAPTARRDYVAGLCCGLAVASEYPAVIPAAALACLLATTDLRRAIRFSVAAVPAGLLILVNNYLITGSPWRVAYGSNPAFPQIAAGDAFGFTRPVLGPLRALLIGEYRGLLFWSPVMLLAGPGIVVLYRRHRALAVTVAGVTLLVALQVASFSGWFGGAAVGPRYLAPCLPFIALAAAYGISRFPMTGAVLTAVSMALTIMVCAVAIDPPGGVLDPLQTFYFERVREFRFAPNLGTLVGAPLLVALTAPFLVSAAAAWAALRAPRAGRAIVS